MMEAGNRQGQNIEVLAPEETEFDITITGFTATANNSLVKTNIAKYLESRDAGDLDTALDVPEQQQQVRTPDIADVIFSYGTYSTLNVRKTGSANRVSVYDLGEGEIAKLGTITINGTTI